MMRKQDIIYCDDFDVAGISSDDLIWIANNTKCECIRNLCMPDTYRSGPSSLLLRAILNNPNLVGMIYYPNFATMTVGCDNGVFELRIPPFDDNFQKNYTYAVTSGRWTTNFKKWYRSASFSDFVIKYVKLPTNDKIN
jgi:hypothetical protein